jgi:methylmalonyl-CoA/ethylmalonyl-CoA epimerase
MSTALGFHHVGIITDDLDAIRRVFGVVLGAEVDEPEREERIGAEVMWVRVGGVALEFIHPLEPHGRPAQILAERGRGVHHIALTVEDVDAALRTVRDAGVKTIDLHPREGARGARIGFVEPGDVAGTLVELVQPPSSSQRPELEVS